MQHRLSEQQLPFKYEARAIGLKPMLHDANVTCPYCGECFHTLVDRSDLDQQYYEDCPVCCRPILFLASIGDNEVDLVLTVKRDDE